MHLRYKYTNSSEDSIALAKATGEKIYALVIRHQIRNTVIWCLVWGFGVYLSFAGDFLFLGCLFVAGMMHSLYCLFRFPGNFWRSFSNQPPKDPITLDVSDEGLREHCDGIDSMAPWPTVSAYASTDEHLFIQLASRLYATIPRKSLMEGSDSLATLESLLLEKNIPQLQ